MGVHIVPQSRSGGNRAPETLTLLTHLQPNTVCLPTFDEVRDEESTAKLQASTHAEAEAFWVQTVQTYLLQLPVTVMGIGDDPAQVL